jgi:hypothetical protein
LVSVALSLIGAGKVEGFVAVASFRWLGNPDGVFPMAGSFPQKCSNHGRIRNLRDKRLPNPGRIGYKLEMIL